MTQEEARELAKKIAEHGSVHDWDTDTFYQVKVDPLGKVQKAHDGTYIVDAHIFFKYEREA